MCDTPTNKRERPAVDEGSFASMMTGFNWRVSSVLFLRFSSAGDPRIKKIKGRLEGGRRTNPHKAFKFTMLPPAASDLTYDIVSAI